MIDPRMFLGIGGPTPQQPMLPPGFRAPAPVSAPPMGGPQGGGQMGIPGMGGLGGLAGMFKGGGLGPDGISAAGLPGSEFFGPPSPEASAGMPGSDLFGPPSPGVSGGSNWPDWISKIFGGGR